MTDPNAFLSRSFSLSLIAVALAGPLGCSSDSGAPVADAAAGPGAVLPNPPNPGGGAPPSDAGPAVIPGVMPGMPRACPPLAPKSGKATATFKSFDGMKTVMNLSEMGCRTLRGKAGAVVGYQVSFAEFMPMTTGSVDGLKDRAPQISVRTIGAYTGNGTYKDAAVTIKGMGGIGMQGPGDLVVSGDGKAGKVTGRDGLEITFSCDAADDTAATMGAPLTDAGGRMIVEDKDKAAFAIDGLVCDNFSGLTLQAPEAGTGCAPTAVFFPLKIGTRINGPATYPLDSGGYAYADFVNIGRVNVDGTQNLVLTQVMPMTGTLVASGGTNFAFTASFTCPALRP